MVRAKRWSCVGAMVIATAMAQPSLAQQVVTTSPVRTSAPATIGGVSSGVVTPAASSQMYYCAKCQQYHARSANTLTSSQGTIVGSPMSSVMQTSATMPAASPAGVSNVLAALNAQRARRGLGSLAPDSQLQAVAQQRASLMARTGRKGHPPGSFSPGRYEGVGWSSSYSPSGVSACFTSSPNMRVAGAAMATGRDGVYFCVVYR